MKSDLYNLLSRRLTRIYVYQQRVLQIVHARTFQGIQLMNQAVIFPFCSVDHISDSKDVMVLLSVFWQITPFSFKLFLALDIASAKLTSLEGIFAKKRTTEPISSFGKK